MSNVILMTRWTEWKNKESPSPILCAVPNIASKGLVLMTECRARCFLLWIYRSLSDQVFVLLSEVQATSMSRTSLVESFNQSMTLRMSLFSIHELHSWPHISQVLYYFVRKFAAIVALQCEWGTEHTKDVH